MNMLLQVYSVEREANNVSQQVLMAILTVLFTYMVAVAGVGAGQCVHVAAFSYNGCSKVSAGLVWFAPAPMLGLLAFLTTTQAVLELGGAYVEEIEREIADLAHGSSKLDAPAPTLVVPQGMRHIVLEAYGRRPFIAGVAISWGLTYILALAFGIGAASIMPWAPGAHRWISIGVCTAYLIVMTLMITMVATLMARRTHWHVLPSRRGRRRSWWSLLYRHGPGPVEPAEIVSRRPRP